MGKTADVSDFDREQIIMARRLGTSISETARLGCSRTAFPSVYEKWISDGKNSSRHQVAGRPRVIKKIWCGTHTTFSYLTL